MKQRIAVLSVLGILPLASLNAQQAATTTFRVSAKVEESCHVTAHGTTLLRAICTPDTTYHIGLRMGASRSAIPGNTAGSETATGVGTGRAVDHALFGGVPAAKVAPAGDYADSVTVHVYY